MMRKFAVALIATTMLAAPALAADAVKSTPAAGAAAATTAAPTVTAGAKSETKPVSGTVTKTDKHLKAIKVAHRHHVRHPAVAKNGGHSSQVKTAKVSEPVKAVAAPPAVSTTTPAATASTPAVKVIKAGKDLKKVKVSRRHHVRHPTLAESGKHAGHVKTAKASKPVEPASVGKTQGQAAHEVKSNKGIAN